MIPWLVVLPVLSRIYCHISYWCSRKKHVKSCRIRHTCGEEEDANLLEEEAALVAENAIRERVQGGVPELPTVRIVETLESAVVTLPGKHCKWCGSASQSRKRTKTAPTTPKMSHMLHEEHALEWVNRAIWLSLQFHFWVSIFRYSDWLFFN